MADSGKLAVWRERLRRYERSRLTVVEFCDQEGVSAPSFYHWRKRLAAQPVDAGPPRSLRRRRPQRGPAFQQVTLATRSEVVCIEWTSGVRMELPAENLPLVRAVVSELRQAHQALSPEGP